MQGNVLMLGDAVMQANALTLGDAVMLSNTVMLDDAVMFGYVSIALVDGNMILHLSYIIISSYTIL